MHAIWLAISHWSISASAILGVIGLITGWIKWRDAQLRKSEVLAWSNQGIANLETLVLICRLGNDLYEARDLEMKLQEVCVTAAILVEQGRLFFKNQLAGDHGIQKEPAYRGFRPCILDPLVVGYQISLHWRSEGLEGRARMCFVAEAYLKKFVSLVQKEVGRSRTVSADNKMGGDAIDLKQLMQGVDHAKVDKFLSGVKIDK
jgi:hypothetical protein